MPPAINIKLSERDARFLFELMLDIHRDISEDTPADGPPMDTVRRIMTELADKGIERVQTHSDNG